MYALTGRWLAISPQINDCTTVDLAGVEPALPRLHNLPREEKAATTTSRLQALSCGGRIRTDVAGLMRPGWNRTPVYSAKLVIPGSSLAVLPPRRAAQ